MDMCKELAINPIDISILAINTDEKTKSKNASSIGIQDVKKFQEKLYLKPIKSEKKACIIQDAHLLTSEAQNALLKILEEPPADTLIILTTDSLYSLLPTICSRCVIKQFERKKDPNTVEKYQEELLKLESFSVSQALEFAEELQEKEKALIWLENMILTAHILLTVKTEDTRKYASYLKKLQETYTIVKTTNTNTRISLEYLFLSLHK